MSPLRPAGRGRGQGPAVGCERHTATHSTAHDARGGSGEAGCMHAQRRLATQQQQLPWRQLHPLRQAAEQQWRHAPAPPARTLPLGPLHAQMSCARWLTLQGGHRAAQAQDTSVAGLSGEPQAPAPAPTASQAAGKCAARQAAGKCANKPRPGLRAPERRGAVPPVSSSTVVSNATRRWPWAGSCASCWPGAPPP